MSFLSLLAVVVLAHLVAVSMPGPDFFCVSQTSIQQGRKAGIYMSLGIVAGCVIHIVAGALGVAALLVKPEVMAFIKIACALYLLYLGWKGLTARQAATDVVVERDILSNKQLFFKGFWCNLLNPKLPLYFLSLFTVILPPDISTFELSILAAVMMSLTFGWFAMVGYFFAAPKIQQQFKKMGVWIDRTAGALFTAFGLGVLFSAR